MQLDLIPNSQLAKASSLMARLALGKAAGPDELLMQDKEGNLTAVEITAHLIELNNKMLALTLARDIQHRKREEEILQQLCHCVQWQHSIEYAIDAGASAFIEVGPGQVLTGLIKRINKEVQTLNTENMTPFEGG